MIRIVGSAQQDAYILALVELDGENVGSLSLTLAQWDRLKQHQTAQPSENLWGGYGVPMFGKGVGVEVGSS